MSGEFKKALLQVRIDGVVRRELLWLHSSLLLSSTSFIFLLSLDISVDFFVVCFFQVFSLP